MPEKETSKTPHPWETHYQYPIKTLLSKKETANTGKIAAGCEPIPYLDLSKDRKLVDNFIHESPGIEPMFDRCVCFGLPLFTSTHMQRLFTSDDDLGPTLISLYGTIFPSSPHAFCSLQHHPCFRALINLQPRIRRLRCSSARATGTPIALTTDGKRNALLSALF